MSLKKVARASVKMPKFGGKGKRERRGARLQKQGKRVAKGFKSAGRYASTAYAVGSAVL